MVDVGLTILKVLASLFSLAIILSPSLGLRRVLKQKHTGEMALMPLVGLWISSHMWTIYGLITDDIFPLFVTYLVGDIASVVYMSIYYHYTAEKVYVCRAIFTASIVVVIITAYTILGKANVTNQSSDDVEQVVGYVTAIGSVALYTSPFETIRRVLKTKSGASIPVLMCTMGFVGNSLWSVYGLLQDDAFVYAIGMFCAFFALLQVALYFVYDPSKAPAQQPQQHEGGELAGSTLDDIASKYEMCIPTESPCFQAIKSH